MMTTHEKPVHLQKVRWGPSDGLEAGIRAWRNSQTEERVDEKFISWEELRQELERTLLPQLFANAQGYTVTTGDYNGKKDWKVRITDQDGQHYCDIWFGGNPDANWEFDGMVRIGDHVPPYVWQVYRRYSDGTYVLHSSLCGTIDEMKRKM